MNFADEDYRRLYTRRTVTNRKLGWEGRAVMHEMLYEFDRAGIFEFQDEPAADIAEMTGLPLEIVQVGLSRLLHTRTWTLSDTAIVWPNFVEAQSCGRSDRLRKRDERDRRASDALTTKTAELTSHVTVRHEPSQLVTPKPKPKQILTQAEAEAERARPREDTPTPVPENDSAAPALPGPLKPGKRERALAAPPSVVQTRTRYDPDWEPSIEHRARGHEYGLSDEQILEREEHCRRKPHPHGFTTEDDDFFRQLLWLRNDVQTQKGKELANRERHRTENPGSYRAAG